MEHLFENTCVIYRPAKGTVADAWNDKTGAWTPAASGVMCRPVQLRASEQRTGPGGGAVQEIGEYALQLPTGTVVARGDRAVLDNGLDLRVIGVNPDPGGRGFCVRALCRAAEG